MAEAGAVIAIIQLADRVVGLCKYWIEAVKDAPSDLRSILLETSMLQTIFHNIEFLAGCDDTSSTALSNLSQADGPVEHCHQILMALVNLLPAEVAHTGPSSALTRGKMATMATSLAWPFRQSKARKLLEELGRHKAAINLALTTESVQDIKDIKMKTTQIFGVLSEHQRNEFCRWLQQTDPSPIHNRARKQVEDGTCHWVLRLPDWADWLAGNHRCLWIHGIPGAGKTVLTSYLVAETERHAKVSCGPAVAVLYYYCYFGHNQDEAAPFLRWLITQLCRQSEVVSDYAYALFKQGRQPSLPELLNALAVTLYSFETIYIIIDAVDESSPRDDLLKTIRDLVTDPRFSKFQLLATSREYVDIERALGDISKPVSMSNPFVADDIQRYVRSALHKSPKFKRWPEHILDEVQDTLSTRARGMFRWAVCQIDRLQRLSGEARAVREALATLPKTLDETYERIFLEISEDERLFVRRCLAWISVHNELYDDGIPCAILLQALEFDAEEASKANDGHFYDEESLRDICGCLLHVSPGVGFKLDFHAGLVQVVSFAHYTVREFLESDRISTSAAAYFRLGDQANLETIRTVLLAALDFGTYNSSEASGSDIDHAIGDYAALTCDFRSYCAATAIFSIVVYPDQIASQTELSRLTLRFLNPSGTHGQSVVRFLRDCETHLGLLSEAENDGFRFWTLRWTAEPILITMLLFSILIIVDNFERLAGVLLQDFQETLGWIHARLEFEMVLLDHRDRFITTVFKGPMIEFFAQESDSLNWGMQRRVRFLLDHGGALPDPTALLVSYVGVHQHNVDGECRGTSCLLRRLLDLGADPNGNGYTITPLQRAVAAWDYVGVETLLRAGADPNGIGNSSGTRWCGIYDDDCEGFEGSSALFICQEELELSKVHRVESESKRQMLEALLVKFGAESFSRRVVHKS